MVSYFDHRAAGVKISETAAIRQGQTDEFSTAEHESPENYPDPRYWVRSADVDAKLSGEWDRGWIVGWKEVTATTNKRTLIAALLPRAGIGHKIPIALPAAPHRDCTTTLLACLSSLACDYIARQKLGTTSLTPFTVKQLPVLSPGHAKKTTAWCNGIAIDNWITERVLELTYTAWDLEAFAKDCGYDGPPFRWDEERRFLLRCELDAAYFHLYLGSPGEWGAESPELLEMFPTPRDAVDYIMETFPIVKRKDIAHTEVKDAHGEITQEGTYITKDTILSIYDEMQQAIDSGKPYQTLLDPPPADPAVAHPPQ